MKNNFKKILVVCFFLIIAIVIVLFYFEQQHKGFRVIFLNIGQGDSIFIESPSGKQMLVDGGPDKSVLRELASVMSFFDRTIDVVLATHPDADHVGGLSDVLKRYKVKYFVNTDNKSSTATYIALESLVADKHIENIKAKQGMTIYLGDGVTFNILFPDRDVSNYDSNMSSIVGQVAYGNTRVMLTGDSPKAIENYLVATLGEKLKSQVLKLGHHGSKTSSSEYYLRTVEPDIAIVSAGLNNRYGHPHQEVLDLLKKLSIPYLNTAEVGRIECDSDGMTISCK